jgi:hypothetical protein
VATLTIAGHGLGVGGTARIVGVGNGFDGLQTITAVTTNTISFANTGSNVSTTPSGGTCDGFDLLASASYPSPTMPSGWTAKQCLGSVLTDGSSHIRSFQQYGDQFWLTTPVLDVNASNTTASTLRSLTVPTGVKVQAILDAYVTGGSGLLYLTPPDITDENASALRPTAVAAISGVAASVSSAAEANIWTNTSGQIRSNANLSSATYNVLTKGWRDPRRRLF